MQRIEITKGITRAKLMYQVVKHPELSWDATNKILVDNQTNKEVKLGTKELDLEVYIGGSHKTIRKLLGIPKED